MNIKKIVKIVPTAACVVSTMLGTALLANVAYASKETDTQPTPVALAANNDITVNAAVSAGSKEKPSLASRKLMAYRIAKYKEVMVNPQNEVTGYDLEADKALEPVLMDALKSVLVKEGKVADNFAKLVALDGNGIKFIGAANNMSAERFVTTYFYGTGKDAYGNENADGTAEKQFEDGGKQYTIATKDELRRFADYLVTEGKDKLGQGVKMTVTKDGESATLDVQNGEEGVYLIADQTNSPKRGQMVSRAMIVGSAFAKDNKFYDTLGNKGFKMGVINLKADTVVVEKKIVGNNKGLIGIGSKRSFEIDTNVPNYESGAQHWKVEPKFAVVDNPTDNLDVNLDSVKVKAGDADLAKDKDYTVAFDNSGNDPNKFRVTLKDAKAHSGARITVTYDTTVNSMDKQTNNIATVEYSNNPYTDSQGSVSNRTTKKRLYSAVLELRKVAMNQVDKFLSDAEFTVTKGDQPVYFKAEDAAKGNYTVVKKGAEGAVDRIKLVAPGLAQEGKHSYFYDQISGLAADEMNTTDGATYTFTETKAPAGYLLGSNPVTFKVTVKPVIEGDSVTAVKYSVDGGNYQNFLDLGDLKGDKGEQTVQVKANSDDTNLVGGKLLIENATTVTDFAKTGGAILLYVAIAAALAGAGAITKAFVRKNRRESTTK